MGNYYTSTGKRPVCDEIGPSLPVSLQLMIYSAVVAARRRHPLGCGRRLQGREGRPTAASTSPRSAMIAMPSFAVALLLSYYLGVQLDWVPTEGYTRCREATPPITSDAW